MEKSIKLSLIAALSVTAFTANVVASDTLAEAFSNGKFKGDLKSFYFARGYEGNTKKDASIFVNGGSFNYITDSLDGFKLGVTLQTSHVNKRDDDSKVYSKDMDATGSRLSESYLSYKLNNTQLKAGRQFISTPLVAGSGSRMIKQAFEAYSLTNSDISNTKIMLSYLTKFQHRTDKSDSSDTKIGDVAHFRNTAVGVDGTKMLYLENKSIKGLNLQAQYYQKSESLIGAKDGVNNLFLNANYDFDMKLKPYIALQYFNSEFEKTSNTNNNMIGAKIGVKVNGFNIFTGYTKTGKGSKVINGIGTGAWKQFTASAAYGGENAFNPETQSLQFGIVKKFDTLTTKLKYTNFDVKNNGTNVKAASLKETSLSLLYKFKGSLKNLKASIDYSLLNSELSNQQNSELRSRLIYSF